MSLESVPDTGLNKARDTYSDRELLELALDQIETLAQSHDEILALVKEYGAQIGPVVDKLQGSPIFKMLGGKK